VWAYTPTQLISFTDLAVARRKIELANHIGATAAAMGDKKSVQKAIRALDA